MKAWAHIKSLDSHYLHEPGKSCRARFCLAPALNPTMRLSFLVRSVLVLALCCGSILAAQATHLLSADLTYAYAGTPASPYQYRIKAQIWRDLSSAVNDNSIVLTCGKNECGTAISGSFTTTLVLTSAVNATTTCASASGSINYQLTTLEGLVQLPPAHWVLSIEGMNRAGGIYNIAQSGLLSLYVKAELDNTSSLANSSPRFINPQLIELIGSQVQQHSVGAFDSEGDSLVYQLVQPLAGPTATNSCGTPTTGAIAPHFQLNPATGAVTSSSGPIQQGRYALAARVDEFRQVNGRWQQIGSITRDMTYFVVVGSNQVPAFSRVALTSSPTGQLLGQTIRVNPGQLLSLTLTAADPDAGQQLALSSPIVGLVPGATFQDLGNGQGQLTWQVPASQPAGRYLLTANAADNACPVPGVAVITLPIVVTQQALAAKQTRQPLAQLPFPMPFSNEVRFQLAERGRQFIVISDGLGRTVAQLLTDSDGSLVWQPSAAISAGLYLARNQDGTQVARLSYTGH